MPKSRGDVQTNANRIDWRITEIGKPRVMTIYPRHSYLVLEPGRPRLPPLKLTGFKGPNNLMKLPRGCVLDSRYVKIYPDHYLFQFLQDPKERFFWGIIISGSVPRVRIYDVVNGLGYAERRSEHIWAGYYEENRELKETAVEIRYLLSLPAYRLDNKTKFELRANLRWLEERQFSIQKILSDRAVRDVTLHLALNRSISRLTQLSTIVERWAQYIRSRPNQIRIGTIQEVTGPILTELPFFGSREIEPELLKVRKAFKYLSQREDKQQAASLLLAERLEASASFLRAAVVKLQEEAERVPESEKEAADSARKGHY